MTTFKAHDPARQATSAYFQQGALDGANDSQRQSNCPPIPALGPDPDCSWSFMYMTGYRIAYTPTSCTGCKNCRGENSK